MKLIPEFVLSAQKHDLNLTAFKVAFIAKDDCKAGGTIPQKELKRHLKTLGVHRATAHRWINAAIDLGLFLPVQNKRGIAYYRLVSWQTMAIIAHCEHLGTPVNVDLKKFAGRSWVAYTWAAYLKRNEGRPVSRFTLTDKTGVPERTQIYREHQAKVKQVENIGIVGPLDKLDPELVINLSTIPGYFTLASGDLYLRLPNSRIVSDDIKPACKGRTKKVNSILAAWFDRAATAKKEPVYRRYSDNPKQTKNIIRTLKKQDYFQGICTILERAKPVYPGVNTWGVIYA
jgi:hypothetical protein